MQLWGVEKVDANKKGFFLGSFMRIRVLLDVSLPLCRGRKVRLGELEQNGWILDIRGFQYFVIYRGRLIMMKRTACNGYGAKTHQGQKRSNLGHGYEHR